MTTSEFIAMLQKADPTGTSHIRLGDGVPYLAELKQGYWDGPYDYIDSDKKWVRSASGNKVDIHCKTAWDFAYEAIEDWNPFKESDEDLWEKCKSKFVFDLNSYSIPEQRQERIDNFFNNFKEEFESNRERHSAEWFEILGKVIELNKRGCRFFRTKETENKWYFGWKFINKNDPKDIGDSNLWHTFPILESGRFTPVDTDMFPNNEYFEYIIADEKQS